MSNKAQSKSFTTSNPKPLRRSQLAGVVGGNPGDRKSPVDPRRD